MAKRGKGKRKKRKQMRKNKKLIRLAPSKNNVIWKLVRRLTNERKYPPELYNKRFKCDTCNRVYCYTFRDTIAYCEDCYARDFCAKHIRDIKTCPDCAGG